MKPFQFALALFVFVVLILSSHASPVAFIVLNAASWGASQIPADWQIKVKDGRPDIAICSGTDIPCIRLRSVKSSFALERRVSVDLAELPYLSWSWKVTQLPAGGDFRRASTDDQAAQLLVAFADNRVISYIWDTTAPKGTAQKSSMIPMVHLFVLVCQSGPSQMNRWVIETQHLAADYERAYKKPPPRVKGLRIQINSQHTGTVAESYFGNVTFVSKPQ